MKHLNEFIGKRWHEAPSMDTFPMVVGRRLRLQRIAFGWRQSDLALRAGLSVQTISALEKGKVISSLSLLRILLAMNQGSDFLRMLDSPNFPNLNAHERYVQLTSTKDPGLSGRRMRTPLMRNLHQPGARGAG